MKLSKNQFVLCHNYIFLTSCVIISSLIWSSLVVTTALALNTDTTNSDLIFKDDLYDFSHSLPSIETYPNQWQANRKIPSIAYQLPIKYFKQNNRFHNWLQSQKRQSDDIPPGFVGARGRRGKPTLWDFKYINGKRNPTKDYRALTEVFPDLWPQLGVETSERSNDEIMSARLGSGKKSEPIVYKDGFLGVRG